LNLDELADLHDIRSQGISQEDIELMQSLSGSYESLFSRRSRQYAGRGLKDRILSEDDYKQLILEEDTFLKRPVVIWDEEIFIGSSKPILDALKQRIENQD
jgi:arsenate reductase-like glutaredoxin family protein